MIQPITVTDKFTRHSLRVITGQAGFFPGRSGAQRDGDVDVINRGARRADIESKCMIFNQDSPRHCVDTIRSCIPELTNYSDEARQLLDNIYFAIQELTDPEKFDNPQTNYSNICLLNKYLNQLKQDSDSDSDSDTSNVLPVTVKEALLPVIYKIFDEYGRECRHDFFGCFNRRKDEDLLREINRVFSPLHVFVFDHLSARYKSMENKIATKINQPLRSIEDWSLNTFDDIRTDISNCIDKMKEDGAQKIVILRSALNNCIADNRTLLDKIVNMLNQSLNNIQSYSGILTEDEGCLERNLSCVNDITKAAEKGDYALLESKMQELEDSLVPFIVANDGDEPQKCIDTGFSEQKKMYDSVKRAFFQIVQGSCTLNYLYKNLSSGNIIEIICSEPFKKAINIIRNDLSDKSVLNTALPTQFYDSLNKFINYCSELTSSVQCRNYLAFLQHNAQEVSSPEMTSAIAYLLVSPHPNDNEATNRLAMWRSAGLAAEGEYSVLSAVSQHFASFTDSYEKLKSVSDANLSNSGTAQKLLGQDFNNFIKNYNQLARVCTSVMDVFEEPFVKNLFSERNRLDEYKDQKFLLRNPLTETATIENCINGYSALSNIHAQIISCCKDIGDHLLRILDQSLGGLLLSVIPEDAENVQNEEEIPENVRRSLPFANFLNACEIGHAQAFRNLSSAEAFEKMSRVQVYNMALDVRKNAVRTLCSVLLGHDSRSNLEHISKDLIFDHAISNKPLAQLMYAFTNIIRHRESIKDGKIDESYRVAYWTFTRGIVNIISEMYYINPSQLSMDYSEGGETGVRALKHKLHLAGQPGKTGDIETFYLMLALSGNISYIGLDIRKKTPEYLDLAIERQKKATLNKINVKRVIIEESE